MTDEIARALEANRTDTFLPLIPVSNRQLTTAVSLGLGLVALILSLCSPGTANAAVTVKVKEFQEHELETEGPHHDIRISGDASDDEISLSLEGQYLKVNGQDPAGILIDFADVVLLHVKGGSGDDSIDLRAMEGFGGFLADELQVMGNFYVAGHEGDDEIRGVEWTIADIETAGRFGLYEMRGGRGSDLLVGSRHTDVMKGGAGDDRIFGRDGSDGIQAGSGADRVWGGDNAEKREVIYGGSGNDVLFGGGGDDLILGKEGLDKIYGGPGRDTMYQDTKSRRGWGPGGVGCEGAPPGLCNPIIG